MSKMTDKESIKGFCSKKLCPPAQEIINRQQAEIERLQEDSKRLKKVQMQLDDAMKMYSTIKVEVIKEYKEKLREHAYLDSGITGFQEMVVDLSDIENIADEMVGEGK